MSFSDITLTCKDCGNPFVFTAGEQEFYAQRGFTESPKRCATCRSRRKAQRSGEGYSAAGSGGYDSYGGGSRSAYGGSSAASYTGY